MKPIRHLFQTGYGFWFVALLSAGIAWPFLTFDIPAGYVVLISAVIYGMLAYLIGWGEAHRQKMLKELWFQAGYSLLHNAGETGQYADKKASDYAMTNLKLRMERLDKVPARGTFLYDPKAKYISFYPE